MNKPRAVPEFISGGIAFQAVGKDRIAFLVQPEYHSLLRAHGGVQKHPFGRWLLPRDRAELLIEWLRRTPPERRFATPPAR